MKILKKKMKEKIDIKIVNYVESFFENVHYSKKINEVKDKIILKLNNEYLKEVDKGNKCAFETIVKKYNDLESMAKSVDYDISKIDKWFNKEITTTYYEFLKQLKKEKKHIYLTTILSILAVAYFVLSILYFHQNFLYLFIVSLIFIIIDIFIIRKHDKRAKKQILSVDSYEKLENLFDKYGKKCLLWLFILFIFFINIIFGIIGLSLNSKSYELVEEFNKYLSTLEFILFFFIKNILIMKWLNKKIEFEKETIYKKSMNRVLLFSIFYFVISTGLYYGCQKVFVLNPLAIILMIYYIYAFTYYFIRTRKFTYHRKK